MIVGVQDAVPAATAITTMQKIWRPKGRAPSRDMLAALCAAAGELLLSVLAMSQTVQPPAIIAIHLAIVAWTWLILFSGRPACEDATIASVLLLLVLVAGPVGAAAAAVMLPFAGRGGERREILQSWYRRLANAGGVEPATALHDRVVAGRVLRLDSTPPQKYLDVIANGTLSERQTALGLMARQFHPDFAPALQAALRSEEPVVRVQAAAVVARVRADVKGQIAKLSAPRGAKGHASDVPDRLGRASALLALAHCSVLEESDARTARMAAEGMLGELLGTPRDVANAAFEARPESDKAIERFLTDSGRLREFRIARRIRDIRVKGLYRLRWPATRGQDSREMVRG